MSSGGPTGASGLPRTAPLPDVIDFANRLMIGNMNVTLDITLTANAATTTVTDARIGYTSHLNPQPLTAHAAAEIGNGTMYVSSFNSGSAVLAHANNAQTDRTFRLLIIG